MDYSGIGTTGACFYRQDNMEIKISVRGLVEFILRAGDIDNRKAASADNTMQEGGKIHRMIQHRMGPEYEAEVPMHYVYHMEMYDVVIDGRADGVLVEEPWAQNGIKFLPGADGVSTEAVPDDHKNVTIDEIKGTYHELDRMKAPVPVHLAQAKCYAYFYIMQHDLPYIRVRMTYCHLDTLQIRYFHEEYTKSQLISWFDSVMEKYRRWADFTFEWAPKRTDSIKGLEFPFAYREGQKELATCVYQTIYHKKKLFMEAPTGTGKTLAVLFPSVKAVGEELAERIFYLTAKTITAQVAIDTYDLLRRGGLKFKTVVLTAKEKICFRDEPQCDPEHCRYARGHFDRINDAMYDLLIHEDSFDREKIMEYAQKYQVCPFEMSLDMSLFSDGVICDYNYAFDPHVYLRRFFQEGVQGNNIFLVDEAHNLLDRGRDMYSASLVREDFMEMKRTVKDIEPAVYSALDKCSRTMLEMRKVCEKCNILDDVDLLVTHLQRLFTTLQDYLQNEERRKNSGKKKTKKSKKNENEDIQGQMSLGGMSLDFTTNEVNNDACLVKRGNAGSILQSGTETPTIGQEGISAIAAGQDDRSKTTDSVKDANLHKKLLDFYFEVSHFLMIYELLDENYVMYDEIQSDGSFRVKLFCVNPSVNLANCMMRARSSILFSATLLPIQYYKKLLGGGEDDYEVYARSIFDSSKCGFYIAGDVSTRYRDRNERQYISIASYIDEITKVRQGNYMVFCPSHLFLENVYQAYSEHFLDEDSTEVIMQESRMDDKARETFLGRFSDNHRESPGDISKNGGSSEYRSLIGFCVLGGIFSEGIDLKNDSLIGAIIVGTGYPQICTEREILKSFFDGVNGNGLNYAYIYPGMNKVMQAAGRVIRTKDDIGVVALLDDRFTQNRYLQLFPREWEGYELITGKNAAERISEFWSSEVIGCDEQGGIDAKDDD